MSGIHFFTNPTKLVFFIPDHRVKKRLETVLDRGRALLEDPFSPQDWAADTVAKQGKFTIELS